MSSAPPSEARIDARRSAMKRRRTIMACSHCRRRKIRCITSEQPPTNPCGYCKRKKLNCEYVIVADPEGYSSPSPDSSVCADLPGKSTPPVTVSRTPPAPGRSPQHVGMSSLLDIRSFPTDPSSALLPTRRRRTNASSHSTMELGYYMQNRNDLYDLQRMHAFQYLSNRASRALAAPPAAASTSSVTAAHSEYFSSYIQMPPHSTLGYTASDYEMGWLSPDPEQNNFPQGG
ncbi:hypothetical protein K438DRAFT_2115412 [Mycena galopus ATCC 62051]|nr:hypothetical protein K438DRAFT_2115412 [Mycena galopus ATCC 62051]